MSYSKQQLYLKSLLRIPELKEQMSSSSKSVPSLSGNGYELCNVSE